MRKIISQLAKLPNEVGIFLIKDKKDQVIFVSSSNDIKKDIFSIITDHTSKRNITLRRNMAGIDYEIIPDQLEATNRELELIQKYHPPLNGRKKGMKQYRFVTLSMNEKFPRARKRKTMEEENLLYLGPFPKNRHIQRVLSIAANYYEIADCSREIILGRSNRVVETCIRRQTKQCMRPCEVEVDTDQYSNAIEGFIKFFRKEDDQLIKDLQVEMEKASKSQEFEKASQIRDDLTAIKKVF